MSSPPRCVSPLVDEDLEHALFNPEDRDVEGAAAEVVDGNQPIVTLVETVGERGRGRLVDDAQHVEARDAAGVARRGPLRVVEVGRHGDDGAIDFEVDLACLLKVFLRPPLQLAEHERRDLRRRELAIAETDPHDAVRLAGETFERQQPGVVLHIVDAAAHEALDRVRGARRIGDEPALCLPAHVALRRRPRHETTDGTRASPAVTNDRRHASAT